jgi:hypothetical protein
MGRFRTFHQVELATLPEVQDELALTDEQKTAVDELEDTYSDERRAQRGGGRGGGGGGGGGFGPPSEEQLAAQAKLNADTAAALNEILDDDQDARILGIFAQVNGTRALSDPTLAAALELSEDQVEELRDVAAEQQQAMFDSFQDFQDMSEEERAAELEELNAARDAALLAVLSDDQKTALEELKGEAIEVDTSSLQGRGGRGGRGGGGGFGGGRGRDGDDGDEGGGAGRPATDE